MKSFLPPMSKIVVIESPYKTPAVGMVDLDGDGILELVGGYYWKGENYIIVLKCYFNNWRVVDMVKGKGYNITYFGAAPITIKDKNNLVVGWQVGSIWSHLSVYELKGTKLKDIYPSREELINSKNQICEYEQFVNKDGIDLSSIEYICSEKERDIKLEKAIVKEFDLEQYDSTRYYYNKVDLDGDGTPEIFVYLVGFYFCGTGGCSGAIFKEENEEYNLISKFSLVNNPIIISNIKTNGYRDIIMNVYGGGIESFFALLKYDGTKT